MGFFYEVKPELIGDIKNLKFIHWRENLKKLNKIINIPEHIQYEN